MITKNSKQKLLNKAALVAMAAALSLSACADREQDLDEPEAMERIDDAQTPIEQEAIGVDDTLIDDDGMDATRGEVSSLEGDAIDDTLTNDDIGVADSTAVGIDDADIIDGSEQEEHISTY